MTNALFSPVILWLPTACFILALWPAWAVVTIWWHGVHKVLRLSTSHCPPPAYTGNMWSTCQNYNHTNRILNSAQTIWGWTNSLFTLISIRMRQKQFSYFDIKSQENPLILPVTYILLFTTAMRCALILISLMTMAVCSSFAHPVILVGQFPITHMYLDFTMPLVCAGAALQCTSFLCYSPTCGEDFE